MVEGPKVTLKASRLSVLIGLQIIEISQETKIPSQEVVGKTIIRVLPVGKELFLVFANGSAIRLHFGMDGSERIIKDKKLNEIDTAALLPKNSRKIFSGGIQFCNVVLVFFDTKLDIKFALYVEISEQRLPRDVMSIAFSVERTLEVLRGDKREVMESIMDQTILPGVGNVIKCEALFNSRINPNTTTYTICDEKLRELIINLRDFALEWYRCSKSNKNVSKNIYGRDSCIHCGRTITLIRAGKMQRITYFCPCCQPINDFLNNISPPNQSCGTDDISEQKENSYLNIGTNPHLSPPAINNNVDSSSDISNAPFLNQPICNCRKPAHLNRVHKSGITMGRLFWGCPGNANWGCAGPPSSHTTVGHAVAKGAKQSKASSSTSTCGFFHWADSNFPKCEHGSTALLRRVLKAGDNNGKYFFCCSKDQRTQQCKFFLWGETYAGSKKFISTSLPVQQQQPMHSFPQSATVPMKPVPGQQNPSIVSFDQSHNSHLYQLQNNVPLSVSTTASRAIGMNEYGHGNNKSCGLNADSNMPSKRPRFSVPL